MTYKILIADDEAHILDTLMAYLKAEGFLVFTAKNGKEALLIFRHEKPDLVILDVMMPEMDGWQTARLIRKESDLPLLFLTARVDDSDQIMGLEIGADEYIIKPFSPRVVVAKAVLGVISRVMVIPLRIINTSFDYTPDSLFLHQNIDKIELVYYHDNNIFVPPKDIDR
mgnify:CR=1 FL=1